MPESVTITHDKKISFHVYELNYIKNVLLTLGIKSEASRMRMRLVNIIEDRITQLKQETDRLLSEYGELDSNGELITEVLDNGFQTVIIKDIKGYQKELKELTTEKFYIYVDDNNINMFKSIKDSLFNSDIEWENEMAIAHNSLCEKLEQIFP